MPVVPAAPTVVPSDPTLAALLLLANRWLNELALPRPTASAVLQALEVSRSRAYELANRLESRLVELCGPAGRPKKPEPPPAPPVAAATELLRYLREHPGAAKDGSVRTTYSDGYRLFVLELLQRHKEVSLEEFANTTATPLGTLSNWLRGGSVGVHTKARALPAVPDIKGPLLQTVLFEWEHWKGAFSAFCDHVQLHCRIPWGRSMLQHVLEAVGVRIPKRRRGRSPDERALAEAFRTWFPHAQWEGDGSHLPVLIDGKLHVFNLELDVDAFSGAFVGAAVTPTEDAETVVSTFEQAVHETGVQPLALLLDNKPSNHCEAVEHALGDTILIRSTPYRGQSKPHVEGGFGLLKPTLEGLELHTGGSKEQLAASYLKGLVTAVLRVLNHRPRRDRDGLSRFQLLGESPTEQEIEQAHAALLELQTKQRKARETWAARQDPAVRSRLKAAYTDLGLDDPKGHILTATARYPIDAVLEGIAIFTAKKRLGTLPATADARYLLGIVRNLATEWESWETSLKLWSERVAASDEHATRLHGLRDGVLEKLDDPEELLPDYIDRALATGSRLDRFFWLMTAADVIHDEDAEEHQRLFRLAARRISATHAVRGRERTAAIRFLAAKVVPLR
jgi:hypothetical protein